MKPRCLLPFIIMLAIPTSLLPSLPRAYGQGAAPPKLVVLLVIDGLSYDQMTRDEDQFGNEGVRTLIKGGSFIKDARFAYAHTSTSPGHATIATGVHPNVHGIIANEWFDPERGMEVYSVEDPRHPFLKESSKKLKGVSPDNLRIETVGDRLRLASVNKSKVFAVSGKDRAAVLLAGKRGTAYFFSPVSGRFVTSSYYQDAYPVWIEFFHAKQPQDQWFGKSWQLLTAPGTHEQPARSARPFYVSYRGLGTQFPHPLTGGLTKPGPDYYEALSRTPFLDGYLAAFAEALIENENLGANPEELTDMLAVSFSSLDYVNHLFGPSSLEAQDTLRRLDDLIAGFLSFLDKRIGLENTLIIFTSDHGFSEAPEICSEKGTPARRIDPKDMFRGLTQHLSKKFGPDSYLAAWSPPRIYLDWKKIESKSLNRADIENEAALFLQTYPGIAEVFTRSELLRSPSAFGKPFENEVRRSWLAGIGGDLYLVQKQCWHLAGAPESQASHHIAPYEDNIRVPLIFYGRWFKQGKFEVPVEMTQVAPTLAAVLNIPMQPEEANLAIEEILAGPQALNWRTSTTSSEKVRAA